MKPSGPLRRSILMALASLTLGVWNARAAAAVMAYRYWDWGLTPRRDDYQVAVLTLALEKTVATHGPFSVTRVSDAMSTSRINVEIRKGRRVNIHAGPWRDMATDDALERNIRIDIPIMSGLLGYRALVVRKDEMAAFKAIKDAAQLKQKIAGLGRGWVDVTVLRHNGYNVDDSGNVATLVDMLVNKRFDYLPLSVTEADSVLTPQLAVVPDLVLYYPLPTLFYVSISEPKLAERLESGLALAKRDGSLDELVARHFQKEIKQLKSSTTRCLLLSNPTLPKAYAAEPPMLLRKP
ncbi:hypothetical protein GTP46_01215 [Duganella sp. FT135W]|uniref:Transporter substrate-binding domain-containing protein n=1 Tax=Duganella flavida TaxID=2692175 RepID=A0A6L8K503_9BURK|nr:amino acid ABC transporter substrate-binding protein [Duganella flavida]MYM21268.1 hypothetical protein [Duganella flavida]